MASRLLRRVLRWSLRSRSLGSWSLRSRGLGRLAATRHLVSPGVAVGTVRVAPLPGIGGHLFAIVGSNDSREMAIATLLSSFVATVVGLCINVIAAICRGRRGGRGRGRRSSDSVTVGVDILNDNTSSRCSHNIRVGGGLSISIATV